MKCISEEVIVCSKCGTEAKAGSILCPGCGNNINQTSALVKVTDVSQSNVTDPSLVGVKGWLLLLCIWLTMIGPILEIENTRVFFDLILLDSNIRNFSYLSVMIYGILGVYSFYSGYSLWKIKKFAIEIAESYFIAELLIPCAYLLSLNLFIDKRYASVIIAYLAGKIPATLIMCIGWLTYLLKSKRVKATYTR